MKEKAFKPRFLNRKRITKMLKGLFDVPLFIICSPVGYGKTTAVKNFLSACGNISHSWFALCSGEDDEVWAWQKFAASLEAVDPELSGELAEYGLPRTGAERDRILDAMEKKLKPPAIIVIDDYHEIRSVFFDRFFTALALKNIPNVHIALISRTLPSIPVDELAIKGLCAVFSELEFSEDETGGLFMQNGLQLSEGEQARLTQSTGGWAAAIYLAMLGFAEYETIEHTQDLTRLINASVYERMDEETRSVLLRLSVLDGFDADAAVFITGNKKAGELMRGLADNNCFVRVDGRSGVYTVHALLRAALAERFAVSEIDKPSLYARIGEWYEKCGAQIESIDFYHKAGKAEKILDIFDEFGAANLFDRAPQTVVRVFDSMEKAQKLARPIAYITYMKFYLSYINAAEGARLLREAKAVWEADSGLEDKAQIMGEIALAEALLCFNDVASMIEHHKKAYALLGDGHSRISSAKVIFTLGSPHTLYLYHKEEGGLRSLVELIESDAWYCIRAANGCGTGFEYLVRAEYCLETGDYKNAELWAYKALYKAKTKDQVSLVICAGLTLARLALLTGETENAFVILRELDAQAGKEGSAVLLAGFEMAKGYIYGILGEPDRIPQWLCEGKISDFSSQGMNFGYIVTGKAAMLRKNYIALEILAETMREACQPGNHIFGLIYAGIYDAVAKLHLYGAERAADAILPAILMAQSDGIITPFAENLSELWPVLQALDTQREWADRVYSAGEKLLAHIKSKDIAPHLSQREKDVLDLLEKGCTRSQIADTLCLSPNTVRRHLQNIYHKLGENNRTLAVKKAKQLGFIK